MKFSNTFALLSALTSQVLAIEAPIPGYKVVDLQWQVEIHPGQPHVTLKGTVEQVMDQAMQLNSNWNDTFIVPALKKLAMDEKATSEKSLGKRGRWFETKCNPREEWQHADGIAIRDGIKHLRSVPGKPVASPGPAACGRVSCSYKSAIWWCNDNRHNIQLSSFGIIADGAQKIHDKCTSVIQNIPYGIYYEHTNGQSFNDGNYNVIVRRDTNHC